MGSLYNKVKVNNPGHSFFNLSNDKKFDCDMGQLIPIKTLFCMPNDVIRFGNEIVARMNPLVAPVMHEVNIYTQYFFVPLRIMFGQMKTHTYPSPTGTQTVSEWDVNDRDFETFLTGGKTGYDTSVSLPMLNASLFSVVFNDNYVHKIEWDSVNSEYVNAIKVSAGDTIPDGPYVVRSGANDSWYDTATMGNVQTFDVWIPLYQNEVTTGWSKYSISDYLEFPVTEAFPLDLQMSAFPHMAYSLIWNNFFRDQNLMDEIGVPSAVVKNVCWAKDYFTSAYTELQRGQAPALPYSAILPVTKSSLTPVDTGLAVVTGAVSGSNRTNALSYLNDPNYRTAEGAQNFTTITSANQMAVNATGMFNVNDLRVAFRVQEWLETNLRVGEHLNEFLIGHFGIGPNDETLQRPVYLGGSKSPVIVSEVLQTSETTSSSPQGNLSGHGITADRNYIGSYRCKEFGIFMGLMYIRPKATYQQGVSREWLYETKYDFPFPEFCHLGNQPIFESEIYLQKTGNVDANGNPVIFGYTERYNELRSSHSVVCGGMRDTFDFWHLGRKFDSAPNYNADFVRCVPSKRIFAVENEPGFIVNVGNIVHAYRPIPIYGDPRT